MAFQQDRQPTWLEQTSGELQRLCLQPTNIDPETRQKGVIPDRSFETIAECLRDLGYDNYADRPRHYAVLSMMNRVDLLPAFEIAGLLDNSFPYPDRRSLPPSMNRDPEACHQFLELQAHVMSAACQMEKGIHSPHVYAESGDIFFLHLEKLGRGGTASVDKVQSRVTKQIYARKKISRQRDLKKDKEIIKKFENELQILKKLDHVHLIKVFASYTDRRFVAIIMKPVASMDLSYYLQARGNSISGEERIRFKTYYGCLANAVAYLHENNIRHKDIKPGNILLKGEDIYITDFGTAVEFDGDKSVTTGTVKVKTHRYQSPEVSRGTKRGTASDIWSLGVTFLEMTTVLKGESLESMRTFLLRNGSKDEYVFENIQGAVQWTDQLRKNLPHLRPDNAPIAWIRDMLQERAIDRPRAHEVCESIRQNPDRTWCCKYCRSDESSTSDMSSDEDDDDTAMEPVRVIPEPEILKSPIHETVRELTISPEPTKATAHPRRSPFHRQLAHSLSGYFSNISLPRAYPTVPIETKVDEIPAVPTTITTTLENLDPYACHIPGSFPDFQSSDPDPEITIESHTLPSDAAGEITLSTREVDNLVEEDKQQMPELFGPFELETAWNHPKPESMSQDAFLLGPFDQDNVVFEADQPEEQPVSPRPEMPFGQAPAEYHFLPPAPSTASIKPVGPASKFYRSLQKFLTTPSRKLTRSRSDENLEIQRQTKSLLAYAAANFEEAGPSVPRRRKFSDGGKFDDYEGNSRESTLAELQKFRRVLDHKVKPPKPTRRRSSTIVVPTPTATPPPPTVELLTEQFVKSTMQAHAEGTLLDPETPSEHIQRPETPQPPPEPKPAVTRPAVNPLISWLANARNPSGQTAPGPTRLTGQNLGAHNKETPPLKAAPPPFKLERASVYMRQVFDDTASSVATSIMSTRTRNTFLRAGLMLPLQDRTNNFVGRYATMGKADAVRMLLKQGCNPGTKKEPRPGPIFSVIRGKSPRHTKCLRALVQHGVDVNVKARRTGKTPLMEAIEQEAWSGYVQVIHILLEAGADPNMKDDSGDNPLLKLLQGPPHPLEEHHRKALALLLSTTYKTSVSVTPLGTQNKPLHLAIRRKDPWAVGMILQKKGCDVEAENSEGLTPLLLAATSWTSTMSSDQLEILDLLLEKKADVNMEIINTEKTPLHVAVSYGLVHAVERLVKNGADPELRTKDKKTARDLANERKKQHGCSECAECEEIQRLLSKTE